jgi:hypothetical protein
MHRRTFLVGLLAGLSTGIEHVAASTALGVPEPVPSIPQGTPDVERLNRGDGHYVQYRRYREPYCDYYCRYEQRLHTPWGYRRYLRRYNARQRAYLRRYQGRQRRRRHYYDD